MNESLLKEQFECMICCEDHIRIGNLKKCGNEKCTFNMCKKCFDILESSECPNCRQPIEGKEIKNKSEETMMSNHRDIVEEIETRRREQDRLTLNAGMRIGRMFTIMQVPFWGMGGLFSMLAGTGTRYACCYGNIPFTVLLCCETCNKYREQREIQSTADLISHIRGFTRGQESGSTEQENPIISPVAMTIETD